MLRKLVMYLSAFLPMFLIMWIKEILLGKTMEVFLEKYLSKSIFDWGNYSNFSYRTNIILFAET